MERESYYEESEWEDDDMKSAEAKTDSSPKKEKKKEDYEREVNELIAKLNIPTEREEGKKVEGALREIFLRNIESQHMTAELFAVLVSGGLKFAPKDRALPDSHRNGKSELYAAETDYQEQTIVIYPVFAEESDEMAIHILSHEIGEMLMRRTVETKRGDERLIDISAYRQLATARYGTSGEASYVHFNARYIYEQHGGDHYLSEMLADDIADFMHSSSPEEMVHRRLSRSEYSDALYAELRRDPNHPVYEEARAIYAFLAMEFASKTKNPEKIKGKTSLLAEDIYKGHAISNGSHGNISSPQELFDKFNSFIWQV